MTHGLPCIRPFGCLAARFPIPLDAGAILRDAVPVAPDAVRVAANADRTVGATLLANEKGKC